MTKEDFENKIIQERCLKEDRYDFERSLKKRVAQDRVNKSLSWYDSKLKAYESSLKLSGRHFSILDFRNFCGINPGNPSEIIKEKFIECSLYDASYEYLDSDENYNAFEEEVKDVTLVKVEKSK